MPPPSPRCQPARPRRVGMALIALALILCVALGRSAAAARGYQIELIVFERQPHQETSEHWDFASQRVAERLQRMQSLMRQSADHETSAQLIRLAATQTRLDQSGHRILSAARWRQPSQPYPAAPIIALPPAAADDAFAAGFARVYATSLIHVDLNLQFSPPRLRPSSAPPHAAASAAEAEQAHYFISEKRRLKFNQIHYFDHPLYGAILGLWPL